MRAVNGDLCYWGVDPGANGAVAVIRGSSVLALEDWPGDERAAAAIVRELLDLLGRPELVLVESQQAMPTDARRTAYALGRNYGCWLGILAALELPVQLVRPQAWKRGLIPAKAGKEASVPVAARLFPGARVHGPRGGAKDGRADALLIARFGAGLGQERASEIG